MKEETTHTRSTIIQEKKKPKVSHRIKSIKDNHQKGRMPRKQHNSSTPSPELKYRVQEGNNSMTKTATKQVHTFSCLPAVW